MCSNSNSSESKSSTILTSESFNLSLLFIQFCCYFTDHRIFYLFSLLCHFSPLRNFHIQLFHRILLLLQHFWKWKWKQLEDTLNSWEFSFLYKSQIQAQPNQIENGDCVREWKKNRCDGAIERGEKNSKKWEKCQTLNKIYISHITWDEDDSTSTRR